MKMLEELNISVLIDTTSEETKELGGVDLFKVYPQLMQCLLKAYYADEEVFRRVNLLLAEHSPNLRMQRAIDNIAARHEGNMDETTRQLMEKEEQLEREKEARQRLEEELARLQREQKMVQATAVVPERVESRTEEVANPTVEEEREKEPNVTMGETSKPSTEKGEIEEQEKPVPKKLPSSFSKLAGSLKG